MEKPKNHTMQIILRQYAKSPGKLKMLLSIFEDV